MKVLKFFWNLIAFLAMVVVLGFSGYGMYKFTMEYKNNNGKEVEHSKILELENTYTEIQFNN